MKEGELSGLRITKAASRLAVTVTLLLGNASGAVLASPVPEPRVLRTINLQERVEWKEIETFQKESFSRYGVHEASPARVRFLTNDTIVVILFPRRRASENANLNITLTALFYDASSGKHSQTMKWPARDNEADLMPLYDAGFLVRAGDKLIRYSAGLQPIRERTLSGRGARDVIRVAEWEVAVAPGGRVALLNQSHYDEKRLQWDCAYELMDVDTLEQSRALGGKQPCNARPATDALATTLVNWNLTSADSLSLSYRVLLNENGQGWRPLAENAALHRFISDDQLLVSDDKQKTFSVINRRGQTLIRGKQFGVLFGGWSSLRNWGSMDGKRFLILDSGEPLSSGQKYYELRFYLMVVDVKARALVAEMGLGAHDPQTIEMALSPDGSRVAVLTGKTLRIYELP